MADDPLAPIRHEPTTSALFFDVDGVLAPIALRPELARVPVRWLAELERLRERYALVGCVSGRPAETLRTLVPVPGLLLAANHGMELDLGSGVQRPPEVEAWLPRIAALAQRLAGPAEAAGGWLEDKGATLTLHWREAPQREQAAEALTRLAREAAQEAGVELRPARMAVELRPPLPLDKGTAVRALLAGRGCRRSLFAGDDVTDLDAFRVVDVAVAVVSDEAPPGLVEAADLVVGDAGELLARL